EAWLVADVAGEPVRYRRRLRRLLGSPALRTGLQGLAALVVDWDVVFAHSLHDLGFLAALAAPPSEHRRRTRSQAMEALIGDLLPPAVLRRSTKSHFAEVLWGPESLRLAAAWDGEGADPELVDVVRLCRTWSAPQPNTQTITLLQSVWWQR